MSACVRRHFLIGLVRPWLMGTIEELSKEEWSEAFYAPSKPYPWVDGSGSSPKGPHRFV